MFPHGETVTLRSTTTTRDPLGNATEAVVEMPWGPCAVAPRYANETAEPDRPRVVVGLTVYGPPPPRRIDADDMLVIRGEAWQVDGEAAVWRSPFTGWEPGVEVSVKRAGV